MARNVRGHHVGRELDAAVCKRERLRQGTHEQRLTQTGHALDQYVPGSGERRDDLLDDDRLAYECPTDRSLEFFEELDGLCAGISFVFHALPNDS